MRTKLSMLVACYLIICFKFVESQNTVKLSYHLHGAGGTWSTDANKCSNVPDKLANDVTSINVRDRCARFYDDIDCEGSSIEVLPHSPAQNDLRFWGFDNRPKSVGPCRHPCDPAVVGAKVLEEPIRIQIYSERNYEGIPERIVVVGCTHIPKQFVNRTLSVNTNGHCIQLYNNLHCESDGIRGYDTKSIELRYGTPSHDDISRWVFPVVRAVSHCGYKCMNTSWIQPITESVNRYENTIRSDDSENSNSQNTEATASALSTEVLLVVILVPLFGVVVSVLLVLWITKKCHPSRNEMMGNLTEKEIQDFLNGLGLDIDRGNNSGGGSYSVELLAESRPYNEAFEIARSQIDYDANTPIGAGEYGVVYKGKFTCRDENFPGSGRMTVKTVAIKTTRPGSGGQHLRSLLKEVKVMMYVGTHENIASFVGCCTENLRNGQLLVLMEYCCRGSLATFLQKNRQYFMDSLNQGHSEATQRSKMNEYQKSFNLDSNKKFDYHQLLEWCIGVARGMEFLAASKVVHSDLAARNILLTENLTAKICDFGLSRQLYTYSQYVKKNQEPLPWRWMAVESLKDFVFSSMSDVWSYGVLCWEVFTLGESPYLGATWSAAFISSLEDGLRLSKPKYATAECYNIMHNCWKLDTGSRPTFTWICNQFQGLITSNENVSQNSSYLQTF